MRSPKFQTRAARKADTRAALLDAGRACFAEAGFDGTTLAQVARRAGVAVGTVYVHFPDKATLLTHALHDDLDAVLAKARRTRPRSGARATLLHFARALYAHYAKDLPLSRVLVKESLFGPLVPGTQPDAVLQRFLADVAGVLEQGKVLAPGVAPLSGAHAFFGLYLAVLIGALRGEAFDVDAALAQLDVLLSTLVNDAPARRGRSS